MNANPTDSADVLIIGGGVIGVCSAYYLAKQGYQVMLVEKDEICAGSSYGNAGLIVPSHAMPMAVPGVLKQGLKWLLDAESPLYIKPRMNVALWRWLWQFRAACNERRVQQAVVSLRDLSHASAELFKDLVDQETLEFGYAEKGGIYLYNTLEGFNNGIKEAKILSEDGIPSHQLAADEIREMEPQVKSTVVGGVDYYQDAHLTPHQFVGEMARCVSDLGVNIRSQTEVMGFTTTNKGVSEVITTRGVIQPAQVVLAAGAWSPMIIRDLQLRLPIQPAKGYSITFKRPPSLVQKPLHLSEGKVAVTPMGDTLRFAGTLELAGLDFSINQRRVSAIRRAAADYLSGTEDLELLEIWRGLRPLSPDTLPIIGRSQKLSNLIIAGGHGTLGVSLGPITGKLVSEIVSHTTPSVDLNPLRMERFN